MRSGWITEAASAGGWPHVEGPSRPESVGGRQRYVNHLGSITLEGDQPVIRESFLQYCARVCKKEGTAVCGLGSIKG